MERTLLNSIEELFSKSHNCIHIFGPYEFILRKYLPGKASIFAQIDLLQQRQVVGSLVLTLRNGKPLDS